MASQGWIVAYIPNGEACAIDDEGAFAFRWIKAFCQRNSELLSKVPAAGYASLSDAIDLNSLNLANASKRFKTVLALLKTVTHPVLIAVDQWNAFHTN